MHHKVSETRSKDNTKASDTTETTQSRKRLRALQHDDDATWPSLSDMAFSFPFWHGRTLKFAINVSGKRPGWVWMERVAAVVAVSFFVQCKFAVVLQALPQARRGIQIMSHEYDVMTESRDMPTRERESRRSDMPFQDNDKRTTFVSQHEHVGVQRRAVPCWVASSIHHTTAARAEQTLRVL